MCGAAITNTATDQGQLSSRSKRLQKFGRQHMSSRCAFLRTTLTLALAISVSGLQAQTAKLHISSTAGDRLTAKPDAQFSDGKPAGGSTFQINDSVKYQKVAGFGASIMEAGLMTLNTLPADKQEDVLRALFDTKDGAGYTAMKTPLAGTDFQSAGPWFTYDDTPGDVELKNFSVARDFGPNGVGKTT